MRFFFDSDDSVVSASIYASFFTQSVGEFFGIGLFFNEVFLFASEVPALLKLEIGRPKLNFRRVYDYLIAGYHDDREETFLEGVMQLLPGHLMTHEVASQATDPQVERWWIPGITERTDLSFSAATDNLRTMFLENIKLHLRSDVPLGAALSGGIDSSSIVCAIRHLEPNIPISTFSYIARDSSFDEENWVCRTLQT